MKEFKIRCSSNGKIMADIGLTEKQTTELFNLENKDKLTDLQAVKLIMLQLKRDHPALPDGAKTYCKEWYKENLYDKRKQISSKYLSKGLIMEDEGIELASDYYGWGLVQKNEEHFSNDYMNGTPDLILKDSIIDIKNSWDFTTFPLFDTEIPNKDYYWQLQGYMELTGKDRAELIYVLMDAPTHLIDSEVRRQSFMLGYDDTDETFYNSIAKNMTYEGTDIKLRIKSFKIERNNKDIQLIKERVEMCRDYIKTIEL